MLYNSDYSNDIDLEIGIQECAGEDYDDDMVNPMESTLTFVKESEENWNAITKGIAFPELKYRCAYGEDMVYTEADIGSVVEAVKRFFKSVLEKLKGLFNKFKAMMMKLFADDKSFINKYKSEVIGKNITYKGFKFTTDKFTFEKNIDAAKNLADRTTKEDASDTESFNEKLRGAVAGTNDSLTASEFTKELFSKLRNGESTKSSLTFSGSEQITIISGAKKAITDAGKILRKITSEINKMIRELENESQSELKKDDVDSDAITILHSTAAAYKNIISYAQVANGAYLSAIKSARAQAKTICVKLIGKKSEDIGANESFDFANDVRSSLSGIKFI